MRFRLKAFGLHLLGSVGVLTLVLGTLYLGWYHWPGWYLTGIVPVALLMGTVDAAFGPMLTMLIASPKKPRAVLARDLAVIFVIQLAALGYGGYTLWRNRPLYYTYTEGRLEVVQASELAPAEIAKARQHNPALAPAWYSLPRWAWAPTMNCVVVPSCFKPWDQALPELSKRLRKPDDLYVFTKSERSALHRRVAQLGLDPNRPSTLYVLGQAHPVMAVFDPDTLQLRDIVRPDG